MVSQHIMHQTEYDAWYELELRRLEIMDECPDNIFPACDEMGPCWDGSERADDYYCSCPEYELTDCPVFEYCEDYRDPETCQCLAT